MGTADNSTKPCSVGTLGHVGKTSTHEEQNQELYIQNLPRLIWQMGEMQERFLGRLLLQGQTC